MKTAHRVLVQPHARETRLAVPINVSLQGAEIASSRKNIEGTKAYPKDF